MRSTGRKKESVGVVWYKERDVCARQADLIVFAFLICGDSFIISKTPIFYFFKSISEELKNQSIMMLDSSELYAICRGAPIFSNAERTLIQKKLGFRIDIPSYFYLILF